MIKNPIHTRYVSEIDLTLQAFDATHPKSFAQQTEIDKYQRITEQRDNPFYTEKPTDPIASLLE
ncbi:MAG: hypothetical protein A3J38_04575 [Gammaproteobacteria bacterium RIFCSPHIGHO2_12_FULL_45_9]|nr:MAG: hypothetical protein A3J38_04575 [Gammaproteobacteria bacterium RIFCSPHIGHO2_12_FULL_45_9]